MSFFGRHAGDDLDDLTNSLRDEAAWKIGILKRLGLNGDVCCLAFEPLSGLLAVGTSRGAVHLFGSLAASVELAIPGAPYRVSKFLNFAQALGKLVVVDSRGKLSVYNLDNSEKPNMEVSYQIDSTVSAVVTSPSHSHAFIALVDGRCLTFDLDRLCISPYTIPNIWAQHEDKNGVFRTRAVGAEPLLTDILIHPRNLNMLLLAYEGGIVLWDITQRAISRVYEVSYERDIKAAAAHTVTTIVMHPSGTIFAAGHLDGAISFWSLEDSERPLAVYILPPSDGSRPLDRSSREPIFKMAWSAFPDLEQCKALLVSQIQDPNEAADASAKRSIPRLVGSTLDYASGETTLTILGGTLPTDQKGVSVVQFPPLQSTPTTTDTTPQAELDRIFLSDSLKAIGVQLYPAPTDVDDFILLPRTNPHFASAHDSIAIILLRKALPQSQGQPACAAVIDAIEFPPPIGSVANSRSPQSPVVGFGSGTPHIPVPFVTGSRSRLSSVIAMPRFRLPSNIWTGADAIRGAGLVRLDKDVFGRIILWWIQRGFSDEEEGVAKFRRLPLGAGTAWPNIKKDGPSSKLSRYEGHLLLVTHHQDLSVRFHDLSSQILLSSSPLRFEYPQPLPHLSIDVRRIIFDSSLRGVFSISPHLIGIRSVHLCSVSLECVIVLSNGIVLLFRFGNEGQNPESGASDLLADMDDSPYIISLTDMANWDSDGLKPVCLIDVPGGQVTAVGTSDIGFHALAYQDGSLVILDMRGPDVLFREEGDNKPKSKRSSHSVDAITALKWVICEIGSDQHLSLNLIASHFSGLTQVYTLKPSDNAQTPWIVTKALKSPLKTSISSPICSFVIDAEEGTEMTPTAAALQSILGTNDESARISTHRKDLHGRSNFWIVASTKEVRCYANVSGDRVARAEWKVPIRHVALVSRAGWRSLVAFTEAREALVYSVPGLEPLHTLQLPEGPSRLGVISTDGLGDIIEVTSSFAPVADHPHPINFFTLFDMRRASPALVNFAEPLAIVPPQPQHLSLEGSYTSWIWGPKSYSGKEIDAALAGPNRPPPLATQAADTKNDTNVKGTSETRAPTSAQSPGLAANAMSAGQDVYARMTAAAAERGEMLGGLEETFSSLETASKDMVGQARRLATQGVAKSWFF